MIDLARDRRFFVGAASKRFPSPTHGLDGFVPHAAFKIFERTVVNPLNLFYSLAQMTESALRVSFASLMGGEVVGRESPPLSGLFALERRNVHEPRDCMAAAP